MFSEYTKYEWHKIKYSVIIKRQITLFLMRNGTHISAFSSRTICICFFYSLHMFLAYNTHTHTHSQAHINSNQTLTNELHLEIVVQSVATVFHV